MSKELKIKMTHNGVVSVDLSGKNGERIAQSIVKELKESKPTKK